MSWLLVAYRNFIILFSIGIFIASIYSQVNNLRRENWVSYSDYQVWRTYLRDSSDILLMRQLMDNQDVSMWKLTPDEADFLIKPENKIDVHRQLISRDLNHSVLILDVQRSIDQQELNLEEWDSLSLRRGHRMTWDSYPTEQVIAEYLLFLAKNYPSICKVLRIGWSGGNRSINMVKISNGHPQNKAILLISGTHAREWIAISSNLVILREIVTKYDEQPPHITDKDWYIIPLLNPDGFVHSYTKNRFWRKSRRRIKACHGVDINRNFEYNWYVRGISETKECSNIYSGPSPNSEPETNAFRDTVLKLRNRLVASVDFHSYGQHIMYPWSAIFNSTPHLQLHSKLAKEMSIAIYNFNTSRQSKYSYGQTYRLIYPATGSLLDWVYSVGVNHSYAIEGPDKGTHGFLLPGKYIEAAGMDMLAAVNHLARSISEEVWAKSNRVSWL